MGGNFRPPQVRDRVLGVLLRAARTRAGLTLEDAATIAGSSMSTLSRIENGKRKIAIDELAVLLTLYKVPLRDRARMLAASRVGSLAVWWQDWGDPGWQTTVWAEHQAQAIQITEWSILAIPTLLQTHDYALGLLAASGVSTQKCQSIWEMRQRRQHAAPPIDYVAYIHQNALRIPFGGAEGFAEQVRHLLAMADRGWGIRVVQADVATTFLAHSWMLLQFARESPLAYVPLHNECGIYLHEHEASAYVQEARRLREVALSRDRTRDHLRRAVDEAWAASRRTGLASVRRAGASPL
ncbi:helix-turn-helix domain-containing protein [Actinokineospora sp. NPDC004072]